MSKETNTSKEETVEEAAKSQFPFLENDDDYGNYVVSSQRHGFHKGAQWQSQTTYTKEQVIELLDKQKEIISNACDYTVSAQTVQKHISSLNSEDFLKEVKK